MKKYVFFIVSIGVILAGLLFYNVYNVQKENMKNFEEPGYILQSASGQTQKIDKYYFNANEEYKVKNNQKVIFKDTSGDEVTTTKDNFIHYNNGAISSLKKGVLINLANIDQDPITYYSISANQIVKKQSENYYINHLNNKLQFKNLIWKISDTKYLIAGSAMTVTFDDGTTKEINGYIELEYLDNQIIKLYNQEIIYQTISSKVNIKMPENIEINLQSKAVNKNGETKMNLANMVIDSDDNVEIVEETKEDKYKENKVEESLQNEIDTENVDNEEIGNNQNQNNQNGNGNGTNNQNGQDSQTGTNVEGNVQDGNAGEGQNGGSGGIVEEEVKDLPELVAPVFKVESFDVDSISLNAQITIQDDEARLVREPYIKILDNATGKNVYAKEEALGTYNIDIAVSTLSPETDYTLVIESAYDVDGITYTKNFVYKIFRTKSVGIRYEKDVFTNNSLKFRVSVDPDSKVKSAEMSLISPTGTVEQTVEVGNGTQAGETAEFIGLNSNTDYKIRIANVLYNGQIISNGFEQEKTFKTLKNKPQIVGPEYEIDKRESTFRLNITNVIDQDNGIQGYRYEIYDTRNDLDEEPVYKKEIASKEAITVKVDEKILSRGVPYAFKVIAIFNDNEKIVEYESEFSNVMKMDGVEFPTVRFEKETITFERIQGKLIIEDPNNTIKTDDTNKMLITYTDSTGYTKQFSYQGGLTIPIDINDLRSNETYKFRIFTTIDLKDDNDPIDECYIGGAIIQTLKPDALMGSFLQDNTDTKNTFNIKFKLKKSNEENSGSIDTVNPDDPTLQDLEANVLSNLEFRIYAGQPIQNADGTVTMPGTAIRNVKIKDEYAQDPYKSKIKEEYYDEVKSITPEFFGAENKDFKDQKYTIQVLNAYDYTYAGGNKIPLIEGLGYDYYVVTTNGFIPDLPADPEKAITVTPVRNRDTDSPRTELNAETIVGYKAQAKYDNNQNYAVKIIYNMYDSTTNEVVGTQEIEIGEDGVIPPAIFNVGDGTKYNVQDVDEARRGNKYYFTYKMMLDLNHDGEGETEWPLPSDNVTLKSEEVEPNKQQPRIIMYPSISTDKAFKFKYKSLDIDNALEKDELTAYINTTIKKDTKSINPNTGDLFEEVSFENLVAGNFEIRTKQRISKTGEAVDIGLAYQYFEGKRDIQDLKYRIELEENSVNITISGDPEKLSKIVAVKATFTDTKTQTIKIEKDLKTIRNNMLTVSFNDISDLLDEETKVDVEAYYDTGITGYDLESDYVAYQKAYKSGEDINYYAINKEGNVVPTTTISENMYNRTNGISSEKGTTFNLVNPIDNKNSNLELSYSEKGYTYQNDVVLQKEIGLTAIAAEGSNLIKFNLMIPGISLLKQGSTSELDITEELDRVKVNAKIIPDNKVEIKNNSIIVELWKTDENLNNSEKIKEVSIPLADFKKQITIDGLEPKTYYYLKFRAEIRNNNKGEAEEFIEKYLYDVDFDTVGKLYYFSTLANVNIENIKVEYSPNSYADKDLKVSYTLDKVLGFQKLRHIIYRQNPDTGAYEEKVAEFDDDLPKAIMEEFVDVNPGSIFTFGTRYKIFITPIAVITNGEEQKEIDLGTKEAEFYLSPLSSPLVGIDGYRLDTVNDDGTTDIGNRIRFKVTMYDNDRIVVGDKYTIKIYDQNREDITPEEYKGEYSTDDANNVFELKNIARDQKYTIEVNMDLDYPNDGKEPYIHDSSNTRTVEPVNESGISVGNVTSTNNSTEPNKIDLLFYNSYKIDQIDQIKYSIYNTSGYNQSDIEDFVPREIQSQVDKDTYYSFTLNKNLPTQGKYYVEMQFMRDGEIVDTARIEHIFVNG